MARTVATVLGIGFLLLGAAGFVVPDLLGMHLSMAHMIIHLVTGAASLYFGLKGTLAGARLFCISFGAVYALLGVAGFLAGGSGSPTAGVPGPEDPRLLRVLPGTLELGTMDHSVHILLGLIYLIGGFMTRPNATRAERDVRTV